MAFESSEEQFTLTEEEQLASVSSDRTLKLKHSELSLDAFWLLVEKEYAAIAQKAQKRAKLLSVEDELCVCLSKTRPNPKKLCKKHQAQLFH